MTANQRRATAPIRLRAHASNPQSPDRAATSHQTETVGSSSLTPPPPYREPKPFSASLRLRAKKKQLLIGRCLFCFALCAATAPLYSRWLPQLRRNSFSRGDAEARRKKDLQLNAPVPISSPVPTLGREAMIVDATALRHDAFLRVSASPRERKAVADRPVSVLLRPLRGDGPAVSAVAAATSE